MIKFTKNANPHMTGLQGYVHATYDELVSVFGEPDLRDGDKVTAEWCLEFEDGTIATIYDWKMGETPRGLYRWHVGGYDARAAWLVQTTLDWARLENKVGEDSEDLLDNFNYVGSRHHY